MKRESYTQFAIVAADSAHDLTEQLNAALKDLKHKNPSVTFEGMIARISYTETEEAEPEDIFEAFELKGAGFHCGQCPFYEHVLNRNGEPDQRVKYGLCPNAKYGKAFATSQACDKLYQMFMSGEVKLCLAD